MIRKAGFYHEHKFDETDEPITNHAGRLPPELRPLVAGYLAQGRIIVAGGRPMFADLLEPSRVGIATRCVRTDGEWVWPNDYAHHVKEHGVSVPTALLDRIVKLNGIAPPVNDKTAQDAIEDYRHVRKTEY